MNKQIQIFNFKNNQIRTDIKESETWFCLIDVCDALNLKRGSKVIDRLSENGVRKTSLIDNMNRNQEAIFINEANLYKLIFKS